MIASSYPARRGAGASSLSITVARQRGPLVAFGVFVVFFTTLQLLSHGRLNYFEISTLASGSESGFFQIPSPTRGSNRAEFRCEKWSV